MAHNNLNKSIMWFTTIYSKQYLSSKDKDFITDLISEEARKTTGPYNFILHDILESKRQSIILIEGTKKALVNLLSIINDNLPYKINYRELMP